MIIFHHANIYAPGHLDATAFVIDFGHFVALGSDEDILNGYSKFASLKVDLGGRTVWPGLTDAHLHLRHLAESMAMVDCETDTLERCLQQVKDAAINLPKISWLRGHGWNQNRWAAGFGNASLLDAVSDGRPAYLTAKSLHAAWANSLALKLAGIDAHTPDPPGGVIQRDNQGEPTGILFEAGAMQLVESIIPPPTLEELTEKFTTLFPKLWAVGLVGVHDFDGIDCWQVLQKIYQSGSLRLRVRKNIPFDHLDRFVEVGIQTNFGDDWLHVGGVKLFADGALGPQTAAMLSPYEGGQNCGKLLLNEKQIIDIGKYAVSHGIALTIHAIGDHANRTVLNAYRQIREFEQNHSLHHHRHRIEHVQIIDPEDLPRLSSLDIIASVQPLHAPSDMEFADKYLGERSRFAYAYQSMRKSGAVLVFGSDSPVEDFNPFLGIHAAVSRRRIDGTPGENGWHPEQRLSLSDPLIGFSQTPNLIANRGTRLGQIQPGFKADFLILKSDPNTLEPQQLHTIRPEATFIEGECVFQSTDSTLNPF